MVEAITGLEQPTAGAETRACAARAVHAVLTQGRSLTDSLARFTTGGAERDRALVQELSFGTLRILPRLAALAQRLVHRPLAPNDKDIEALILIGLYQLAETRVPDHAAVAATVSAARALGKPHTAGLVNAVLRRYLRERAALEQQVADEPGVRDLFPTWLREALVNAWPEHWPAILAASNRPPPMTLRVNAMKTSRAAYAEQLAQAGLTARPIAESPAGLMLDRPVPVTALPGFDQGLVSVQDAGAQLAAELLDARPGERILDACAAPGGKSAHILERSRNQVELTAIDCDPTRLDRLRSGLDRLGLTAAVIAVGDASLPQADWTDRHAFDRILLDVPCTATGVIRRHPDIKWLRRPQDLAQLCTRQARLLDATWSILAPGGRLLYVTCSLLPDENTDQIAAFLARHPDAIEEPLPDHWGLGLRHGRQTLPAPRGPDGFYYAALHKARP